MAHERRDARSAYGDARVTSSRATIWGTLEALPGVFTVEELAAAVRRVDRAAGATATVYRAVAALEANGSVERVGARGGHSLFAACGAQTHHHHIVCEGCGATAHTECPVVSGLGAEREDGFVITRHEVTMYGLCPACAPKAEA